MVRKAQVAIWIIIGIALVATIAIIFFVMPKTPEIITGKSFSPENYLDQCVKRSVDGAVDLMLPRGGFLEVNGGVRFENVNVTFLCEMKFVRVSP